MDIKRHIGRDKNTGARLVVVFLQLPDDSDNCLVVYSDSLPDRYHDNLMEVVDGADAQQHLNLYEVLSRHMFFHGGTMLPTLHSEKLLRKLPIDSVLMTPTTTQQVPLRDIINNMDGNKSSKEETPTQEVPVEPVTPVEETVEEKPLENAQIAANLMVEAEMLMQAAEEKKNEAYQYDPSLKPKPKRRAPAKKTTAKAS